MICEIICERKGRGYGAGPAAFSHGIDYVCGKAACVELRNIASPHWSRVPEEMLLTFQLSDKVKKPYYHLILSWPCMNARPAINRLRQWTTFSKTWDSQNIRLLSGHTTIQKTPLTCYRQHSVSYHRAGLVQAARSAKGRTRLSADRD